MKFLFRKTNFPGRGGGRKNFSVLGETIRRISNFFTKTWQLCS